MLPRQTLSYDFPVKNVCVFRGCLLYSLYHLKKFAVFALQMPLSLSLSLFINFSLARISAGVRWPEFHSNSKILLEFVVKNF